MKFTPDQFAYVDRRLSPEKLKAISDCAQAAFDKWLAEQRLVYGHANSKLAAWSPEPDGHTHSARLVAIEELK